MDGNKQADAKGGQETFSSSAGLVRTQGIEIRESNAAARVRTELQMLLFEITMQ